MLNDSGVNKNGSSISIYGKDNSSLINLEPTGSIDTYENYAKKWQRPTMRTVLIPKQGWRKIMRTKIAFKQVELEEGGVKGVL